ncbi:MAG TPA: cupin domain-containing protein [Streptosporangiaceae bacterium]|nr:cupin domain-containing protein [Streptosporangiaceae bacterium]
MTATTNDKEPSGAEKEAGERLVVRVAACLGTQKLALGFGATDIVAERGPIGSGHEPQPADTRQRPLHPRRPHCARTARHAHSIAQTLYVTEALYVTEGEGLAQVRGEAVIKIRPGDVVSVAGNEWHWHGAAPDRPITHLSLTEGDTDWGDHVTDAEYDND